VFVTPLVVRSIETQPGEPIKRSLFVLFSLSPICYWK
jgi:hypothetical protein